MNELTVKQSSEITTEAQAKYTREQIQLIKEMFCRDATDAELSFFLSQCSRLKLDPTRGQIYAIKRYDEKAGKEILKVEVGIDGFRVLAERTGLYKGSTEPLYKGKSKDSQWVDCWTEDEPPHACKVGVIRIVNGNEDIQYSTVYYKAKVQLKKDGTPNRFWKTDPAGQMAKCAEVASLRKAFPNEMPDMTSISTLGELCKNPLPEEVNLSKEDWFEAVIHDSFLPPALRRKEITYLQLLDPEFSWSAGDGKSWQGIQLVHMWAGKNSTPALQAIANELLKIWNKNKEKEQKEIIEPSSATASPVTEPPATA